MSTSKMTLRPRALQPLARTLIAVLSMALVFGSAAWALDLLQLLGIAIYQEQFLATMLGCALGLVFLLYTGNRTENRSVSIIDLALSLLGFGCGLYVAAEYPRLLDEIYEANLDALILGGIIVVLVLEGLRRTTGWILPAITAGFALFGLLGHLVPGQLQGREVAFDQLTVYLGLDSNSVLGMPLTIATAVVIPFIVMGMMLQSAGGSDFFTEISTALMGKYRGGSAKIAVTASGLFGSISGSAVSNVTSTGMLTIPLMKKGGYPGGTAAAIEAVASTGGQLVPPVMGAAAFLMAEFLQVPYSEVVMAALIPSLLYYLALFLQVDMLAAKNNIAPVPEEDRAPAAPTFKAGWQFLIPFVLLILALFGLNWDAGLAALLATGSLILIGLSWGYKGRRMSLQGTLDALLKSGCAVLDIIMIGAAAGIIIGVMNISGLGFGITMALVHFAQGNLVLLLLLSAIVCIILGMGMPTVGVYILLATLVAPALVEVGVSPVAAHLFVLYFGMMSMLTPPVAIAAFAAATIAGEPPMKTGWKSVCLGWTAYVIPFIFVAAPALLFEGSWSEILLSTLLSVVAVWFCSAAIIGYSRTKISGFTRGLFGMVGCILLFLLASPADFYWQLSALAISSPLILNGFIAFRPSRLRSC
ncbi:ATP-binding protein [Marinobacterium nitratireducens]|uniref:ATP-binding protein n=1 Tax=Marinobacterium nitratireducens TaxID=518897 RepID=A0A917ZK07_9GAMM|nr:TRAP transporter fused permease subunit [Marinobacterium nitratireducens]GGO83394.1 ATP-binding protein [Marinobacterium nitratireducens]